MRSMKEWLTALNPLMAARLIPPLADNAGHQAINKPRVLDGPTVYFVTLPVHAILDGVHAADLPAELSLSAGAFLCKQATYELRHYLTTHQLDIPADFAHLLTLPE